MSQTTFQIWRTSDKGANAFVGVVRREVGGITNKRVAAIYSLAKNRFESLIDEWRNKNSSKRMA